MEEQLIVHELRRALEFFGEMKASVCRDNSGPVDLPPILHFKFKHMRDFCGLMVSEQGDPIAALPKSWQHILENGVPEIVMYMTEGYVKKLPKDSNTDKLPTGHIRGEFEREFKEDPSTDVREAITMQAVDIESGKQFSGMLLYKYDDSGVPEFEDVEVVPCEGPALEARMASVFANCRSATLKYCAALKAETTPDA